jgi:hypothetical protein
MSGGVVQPNQYLAGFHQVSFPDKHFPNNAPFEMLHLFVLARGNERTRRYNSTLQWSHRCPSSKAEHPNN